MDGVAARGIEICNYGRILHGTKIAFQKSAEIRPYGEIQVQQLKIIRLC